MAVPAPCGDHRCLQERKQLRKELEKGRKNLIAYIGLECITESLFGSEFFQKISPFKDEERKETGDWDSQQENCVLCAVRQEAVAESIANHQAYLDRLEDGGNHLSHRDRVLKAEQWLAQSAAVSGGLDPEDGDQKQPLDLSKAALLAAANQIAEAENGTDSTQSALRVPSINVHRPTTNTKKGVISRVSRGYGSASYTQDDLRLALAEVRKGKVGTRRAAMLYGIPRSTIRNHLNRHSFLCEDEDESSQDSKPNGKRGAKAAKVQNGTDDDGVEDDPVDESDPVVKLRSFLRNRNEAEKTAPAGLESSLSQHLIKELALNYTRLTKTKTLDVDSLAKESLSTSKNGKHEERVESDFTLPEYIFHVLIQRHLESEKKRVHDKHSGPLKPALRQPASQPNVDLKVPLYKPMNVSTDTQNSDLDNSVSSWIKPDPDAIPGLDWKSQLDNMSDSRSSSPFSEKRYSSQDASNINKRPKRGRYRCYDRDALMQAVGAVQRGEMTVTRAGNVYGVPHSTLEYKVKERHLKRSPKKQAPKVSKPEAPRTESHQSTPTYSALNMYDASHISPFTMASRPFESFAERLRAMSEKQAIQNSYGYLLKQSLETPGGVGVVMQDLGQMQSALTQQAAAAATTGAGGKDSYPMEDQLPLLTNPAVNPLLLGKQQWVWALHPAAAAAYQHTYKEALQQQQVLYGMQQDKAATAAAAAAAGIGNASVSDAINRLVEAHIYDSLYGNKSDRAGNKSASNPPSESGEPGTSGENNHASKRSSPKGDEEAEEEEQGQAESKKPKKEEDSEDA